MGRKRPAITLVCIALSTPPQKCAKTELSTKTRSVDCDAPLSRVQKKSMKANVNRDLRTIRSLKLRLLPDQFVAGACFVYSVAHSLHALGGDTPLSDTWLRAKPTAVYHEMCDILVTECALSVHRDLQQETCAARPQGGLLEHFAGLAKHVASNVVLLRTNTYNILTLSFWDAHSLEMCYHLGTWT